MSKSKESNASEMILDYLVRQNRPYSAIDIQSNMHKVHGKTLVVKTLETLVSEGKIKSKSYGKQTVFVADQSQFPVVDDSEIRSMDAKIAALSEELKEAKSRSKQKESVLRELNSSMTTQEAQQQLIHTTEECERLGTKLESLQSNANTVSPEERKRILSSRESFVKAWRKRKRIAKDMTNAILEGYPKSQKELFEEIGIETDEDYQVKPPDTL